MMLQKEAIRCFTYFKVQVTTKQGGFFFKELIPHIEKIYCVKANKEFRAIAGQLMGGGGTIMYAFHHPEMFSSACPLSASIGSQSIEEFKKRLSKNNECYPDSVIQKYVDQHNAISAIKNVPEDQKNAIRWYFDCGDDDFLYEGNYLVHIEMRKRNMTHEFRMRDGGHCWPYWRESLPSVLEYISDGFHRCK